MEYKTLGRTGLRVSVAGMGSGGHSRLGQQYDESKQHSIDLVREALDLGVNFIDTSENYGTEDVIGAAIKGRVRSQVVVSTKTYIRNGAELVKPTELGGFIETSLRNLGTDYIDIYHFHGVRPADCTYVERELLPALEKAREAGKIRFIGMTEGTSTDLQHESLGRAVAHGGFDAVMFAFHMMHQNARQLLLPGTRKNGVGALAMCAMRGFFSDPSAIETVLTGLESAGQLPGGVAVCRDALAALVHDGGASSLVDAAYRYARHEAGIDVVLFGTGNKQHLRSNIESILRPPLPKADLDRIATLFGHLVGVGLAADHSVRTHPGRRKLLRQDSAG